MGIPAFVAAGTFQSNRNVSTFAVPYPAGVAAGQIAIIQFQSGYGGGAVNPAPSLSPSTGWVAFSGNPIQTQPSVVNWSYAWYKILDGTETGTVSVNFTGNGFNGSASAQMTTWSGVDTSSAIIEAQAVNQGNNGTPTGSAITTLGANRLVVMLQCNEGGNGGNDTGTASPAGWTKAFASWQNNGPSFSSALRADYIGESAAGLVPAAGYTLSPAQGVNWGMFTFALIGAPSVISAVGAASGHATDSGAGYGKTASAGATVGHASVAGLGVGAASLLGASSGISAVLGHALAEDESIGQAAGAAIVGATGAGRTDSVGQLEGLASLDGHGQSPFHGKGVVIGAASVAGSGIALASSIGNARGQASVSGRLFLPPPVIGVPVGSLWWKKIHTPPKAVQLPGGAGNA